MQVKEIGQLVGKRGLQRGDYVAATFSDINGNVIDAEGIIDQITIDTLRLRVQGSLISYDMWRMLSIVCISRDISYVREGSILSDLERLAYSLEDRLGQRHSRSRYRR